MSRIPGYNNIRRVSKSNTNRPRTSSLPRFLFSAWYLPSTSLPLHKTSRDVIKFEQPFSGGKVLSAPSVDAYMSFVFNSISIGQ